MKQDQGQVIIESLADADGFEILLIEAWNRTHSRVTMRKRVGSQGVCLAVYWPLWLPIPKTL